MPAAVFFHHCGHVFIFLLFQSLQSLCDCFNKLLAVEYRRIFIKLQNVEKRLFYAVRRGTHSIARERFQFSASAGTGYDTHSRTLLSLLEVRVRNLKNMYGHTSSYYLI